MSAVYAAPEGRPSYPPLRLVKALLLAQWYDLADLQLEEALGDRRSFRRVVGLRRQDDTPDHSTISRFRRVLAQRELSADLLAELTHQLEQRGVLKQGTLLDATVVEATGPRAPRIPTPTGSTVVGGPGRTSAPRCIWGWARARCWCAGAAPHGRASQLTEDWRAFGRHALAPGHHYPLEHTCETTLCKDLRTRETTSPCVAGRP